MVQLGEHQRLLEALFIAAYLCLDHVGHLGALQTPLIDKVTDLVNSSSRGVNHLLLLDLVWAASHPFIYVFTHLLRPISNNHDVAIVDWVCLVVEDVANVLIRIRVFQ